MAREILFRGRTRDGKKCFCGDLVQNGGLIRIWEKDDSNGMYHEAGIGFVGFEKDKHMYDLSMERYRAETAQMSLSDLMKGWR